MDGDPLLPLIVPPRRIPAPRSVSKKWRDALRAAAAGGASPPYPEAHDHAGWRAMIAQYSANPFDSGLGDRVTRMAIELGGVPTYRIEPRESAIRTPNVLVDIHAGGFYYGAGEICQELGTIAAVTYGVTTYAIDYRMPPDHPYPAALDDCVNAYAALLETITPECIVVQGTSAGGNLAAALMLRLHDAAIAMPAGVVLRTPAVDLTESGDSFHTNLGIDTSLTQSLMNANHLYAGEHALTDPYLSPLFGAFGPWHPPTALTTGTRDLFLSNTVRMHRTLRRAGVRADLIVEEAGPHGGIRNTPEDEETARELRILAETFWADARRR